MTKKKKEFKVEPVDLGNFLEFGEQTNADERHETLVFSRSIEADRKIGIRKLVVNLVVL